MGKIIIHSHRGLASGAGKNDFGPENTLAAFRGALEAGCGIELDVRLTRDHNIAIIHDNNLEHGAGLKDGKTIGQMTMAEIKQYKLFGTDERVPSFDELAQLLKQFPLTQDAIAIHLKLPEQTEEMMTLLADKITEYELESCVFIFDVTRQAADFFKKKNQKLRWAISLGYERHAPTVFTLDDWRKDFQDAPVIWWDEWGQAAGKLYSQANLAPLKENGAKVYVISPDVAYQSGHPLAHDHKYVPVWKDLIKWGVDGICTDQTKELMTLLAKH